MKKLDYPQEIKDLVFQLKKLPGIGPRSAERIAVWMMQTPSTIPKDAATAILEMQGKVAPCRTCGFFAREKQCDACDALGRESTQLCVVEQATDVLPLERTNVYLGYYHILGGRISPLDNVSPDDLRIPELVDRLGDGRFEEVILAVGSDVEGEATANYLSEILAKESIKVTRLAQGLPAGGGLENADELTLFRALNGRREMNH